MAVEKELIKGINQMMQGNEAGFNTLYSYTYNYVYGRARMIMKDEQDALDLTQETYIQAYKHIHTLEDVNNIYAWLGGIVYRSGMKIFRKKRDVLVNEDAEGIFENVVSEDKDFRPEVTAEEKATSNIIMSMIDELPELQKAAILAFYYDNMKIDDIAEMFDCSSNTIKSRLNYAKKFLKDRVEMHEKKYAYKLHSLSPAVLFLALRSLLAGETYTMSAAVAQGVYNASCSMLGFVPTAIAAAGGAGASVSMSVFAEVEAGASAAGTASVGAAGSSTAAGATATSTTAGASVTAGTATATAAAASTGMAFGTKLAIGLAVVATAGTVTVGGAVVANNGGFDNLFGQETVVDVDDEDDDYEDETETMTEDTETVVEETYGWEKMIGEYVGPYNIKIVNVHATSSNPEDVTFDIEFKTGSEVLNVEQVPFYDLPSETTGYIDGSIFFEGEASGGSYYYVKLIGFGEDAFTVDVTMSNSQGSVTLGDTFAPSVVLRTTPEFEQNEIDRKGKVQDDDDVFYVGTTDDGLVVNLEFYDVIDIDEEKQSLGVFLSISQAGQAQQIGEGLYGYDDAQGYTWMVQGQYAFGISSDRLSGTGYFYVDKEGDVHLTFRYYDNGVYETISVECEKGMLEQN